MIACRESEFEPLFRELATKAKAHDKGVNYYDLAPRANALSTSPKKRSNPSPS
jgi:hypothetical protein